MIAPTHISFGLFFSLFISSLTGYQLGLSAGGYLAIFLGSILPDIDTPQSMIGRCFRPLSSKLERRFGHRTITHSLLGWLTVSLLALPLLIAGREYFLFFSLAYLSHILLDMANIQGVTFFWPDKKRDVLGQPEQRLASAQKKEAGLTILFLCLAILSLPLSKYGIRNSLGWLLGDHTSASAIAMRSNVVSYLEFKATDQKTHEQVTGRARILGQGDNCFIVDYNGVITTVGSSKKAVFKSSRERIAYTKTILTIENLRTNATSYDKLLENISDDGYFSGTISIPEDQLVKIPPEIATIEHDTKKLTLLYARKGELEKLRIEQNPQGQTAQAYTKWQTAERELTLIKKELENDGLTALGREKLGIDHTKDVKYQAGLAKKQEAWSEYQTALKNAEPWYAALEMIK